MYTGIERITPECPVLVAFRSLLGSLILLISIFIILSFELCNAEKIQSVSVKGKVFCGHRIYDNAGLTLEHNFGSKLNL